MADPAHEETERLIREMERKISREYQQAIKDVEKKIRDYTKRYNKKNATWQQWVADGIKDKADYQKWRINQIAMSNRWYDLRDALAEDFHNANMIARRIVYGYMPEVYAINHNYGVYEVEHGLGIDTSYTLYNRRTVEMLLKDNPNLFRPPGNKMPKSSDAKAIAKDIMWNKNKLQSVMVQAVLQGESMPDIATRVAKVVGKMDRAAAIRTARTMTTGAQNAGRLDSYFRAQDLGIKLEKTWVATLDSRTRHSHRHLDGETVPLKEEYSNGLMYPGDPDGDASEIMNCRCKQIAQIEGFERDISDLSIRNVKHFENESYEEWKAEKKSKSNRITLPEEKRNAIRGKYTKEYREGW